MADANSFERYRKGAVLSEEAAGQLFIFGFDGTKYERRIGQFFAKIKPSGVILFSDNIENSKQTMALIADLKKLGEETTGLPLFVAVDQEGGRVSRLPSDMPLFPTARSLGKDGSVQKTELVYSGIGAALKTLGFNLDFAPVLDIDSNPENRVIGDRSFSDNPEKVIAHVGAAISGLKNSKTLACVKHFPGHGDTTLDSHHDLPTDPRPKERFYDAELKPFIAAIADKIEFIMTAHVVYPAFDEKYPATLSKKIVTDLLRDELKYEGVIIGDDLDMKAISGRYSDADAARLTFQAGADMALVCHETARRENAVEAVRAAIDKGEISEKQLTQSLDRIMTVKERL